MPNDIADPSFSDLASDLNSRLSGSGILRMMRRHLGMMLLMVVTGVSVTAFWLAHQVPIYTSSAAILLKSSELPSETVSPTAKPGLVSSTQVFTEAEVLRSREFASRLARRLALISDPRFNPALVDDRSPGLLDRAFSFFGLYDPDALLNMPPNRQHAEVIEKLLDLYSVLASEQHNVIDIRAQHTDPVLASRIVNETAQLYIDMQTDEQIAKLDRDIRFMRQRSQEIAGNLSRQQTRITQLMLENQLLDDGAVRTLLAEQSRLRNRLGAFDANAPDSVALEGRIAEIDTELAERVGAEIKLAEHEIALETETSRLDAINKRLDELVAQRESPTPSVAQISVAEVPSTPSSPNSSSTLAVAFVIFCFLATVSVLLRESLDKRVLFQEHAEGLTGLDVVASLTRIPKAVLRRYGTPHDCVANDASPGYSNAIRALVSKVMENTKPGRASIILIGSAKSAEGKSSIAASLAVAAAMDDLRVLLIDFDVHRFGLSKAFRHPPGQVTFGEVLSDPGSLPAAITATDYPGVDLLNFRQGSKLSRRAMRSEVAHQVLEAIRESYDLVIIDTPPILAAEEAGRLQGVVDKAILVSRWGEVSREALYQTAKIMRRSGLPVIGIAVNAIRPRVAQSYGYLAFCEEYYQSKDVSDA